MEKSTFINLVQVQYNLTSTKGQISSVLLRISVTLRYIAGGFYLDIAMRHQQSISSVYRPLMQR